MKKFLAKIKSVFKFIIEKFSVFKVKFLKLKLWARITVIATSILLIVAIILGIVLGNMGIIGMKSAFNSEKRAYSYAKIKLQKDITVFDLGFTEPTDSVSADDEETSGDDEFTEYTNITINKDKQSEISEKVEMYFFKENNKDYITVYDSILGKKDEPAAWTKSEIDEIEDAKAFSFSRLKSIDTSKLHYKNGEYVPEFEYLDECFGKLYNLNSFTENMYMVESLSFKVRWGKIYRIKAVYILDAARRIEATFNFSYKKEKIDIPKLG